MSIRRCWSILLGLLGVFASGASAQTLTLTFVDAAGRPASFYLESTRVYVQVEDTAANSPGTVDSVPVTLQTDLSGDQESLLLTETGADTGIFLGTMDLRTGPSLPGNSLLETRADGPPYHFDTVRATYAGHGGATASVQTLGSLTSFIDAYGNEVTSYAAGETVRVRVEDHNADNPTGFDSVMATVQSLDSGDAEGLQLQEVAKSGGIFEGSLPMERNAPASSADGRLQAHAGESLQAMHTDSNGLLASGAQANVEFLTLSFFDESGRPTTEALENGTARVRVTSAQDNASPFATDQVQIQLQTQYAGDQEFLTLNETGLDTGVFEGSIRLSLAPASQGNGTLETLRSGPPDFLPEQITATAGPYSATAHALASRVIFMDGFGRPTTSFPVGGVIGIRVMEPARNFDPQQRETTQIQLQVPGDQEIVTLFETGFNTGVFEGTIGSERGGPLPNNGRLEGQDGQTIFATYPNVTTPNPTLAQAVFTGGQVLFVDAAGQPASVYLLGTRARVRVEDHSANVQSSAADTVIAGVTTELGGDVENLTLTETGPNTGIFEGEIDLREGPSLSGNGILETREEFGPPHEFDTLHASYAASSNGSVSTATAGTLNFRIRFIDGFGNVVTSYAQGSRAYVRVEDHRFNNPTAFDRVFVIARSPSGDFEFVELNETTKTSGIFEGSLPIDSIGAPNRDDRLQAHPGDEITAERDTGFTAKLARARIDFLSVGFIDETGEPTMEVLENGTARVRLVSPQDNANPGTADQLSVQLRTRYAGDQEFLTLTETGPDTGVFEGSIRLNLAPSVNGNGTLETLRSGPPEFLPEEITVTAGPYTATAHALGSKILFIDGFGRATSSFPIGGAVGVRVMDPAHNFDPQQRETTQIQLQVPGDQEIVTLFETSFNTGVFEGTISSERGGAQSNNGRLEGQAGHTIFATYPNATTPNPTLAQAVFTGGQVLFVDAAGQPASVYLLGTRARVRVEDHSANVQSSAADTVIAGVTTELGGDVENLTLTETGPNTGIFEGEIDLRDGPSLSGNGILETREEFGPPHEFDTLHASYVASSNGSVSTATAGTLNFRIRFIDGFGNVVTSYAQGSRAYVRVEDHRFNNPTAFDRVFVIARSPSGDFEFVELNETTKASGIFEGSLPIDSIGAPNRDDRLQAHPGDEITAERDTGFTAELARARIEFLSVGFIDETGEPTMEVLENGTARVRLVSPQDNANPGNADQLSVQLRTRYAGDQEFLTLTETGPDTGVFEGSIRLNLAPSVNGNGTLETLRSGPPEFLPEEITVTAGPYSATAHALASKILFIDGFGRVTSSFPLGGPVGVRVVEPAHNFDPQQRETTQIQLQVPGDQEIVTLFETGFNTGVFEGTISSERGGPQPNDGRLEGQAGHTIFATYPNVTTPNPTLAQAVFTGGQILFVDASGQPASIYLVGARARVRVEDHSANVQSSAVDTVIAGVTTELGGDVENLTLTETGPDTGIFEGEIDLREGPSLSGNGILETREEFGPPHEFDTLHASYVAFVNGSVSTATAGTLNFRIGFIDAYGNVVTSYAQGSRAHVRVEDHRFNNPTAFDRVFVIVRSPSGDFEFVELNETTKTSGIFEGSLPIDSIGAPNRDDRLQAHPGDEITAERDTGFTAELARARIEFLSVGFIDETGEPTVEVLENGTARVRLVSPQDNANPGNADQLSVQLRTRYAGDQEFLTLTETGPNTGVFEGGIRLSLASSTSGNGTLETLRSGPPEFLPEEITVTAGPYSATAHALASKILFIDGFGRVTSSFPIGGPVGVRVMEPARNFDPQQRETTQIQLQVPGDQEIVTLFETSFNTGVFEGTIGSYSGTPQLNNGSLDGQAGQTIFATYQNVTTPNPTLAQAVFTGGQVLFVDASGQPASVYLVGARARVRVEDHSANVRSSAVDTVIAGVTTELGGDVENLTLTETGPNTGIFEGEIDQREGPSLSGNGILETREEFGPPHEFDTLHASYVASSNGSVSTATAGTLNFRIGFIDAYGNAATSYAQGSRAYVRLEDHRFNNFTAFDRAFVIVRSPSGDFEFVELDETTKTSGIFEGSLPIDSIGAPNRDDRLQAHPGDEITAERDTGFTAELARARIEFLSVGFIDETGEPTVEVLENGTARVRLVSPQDNANPGNADQLSVQLRTRYAGDQEFLTLTETGPGTGVFEGAIRLNLASSVSGNGTLETLRSGPPEFLPEEITVTAGPYSATAHALGSKILFIDGFGRVTSSFPIGGPVGVRVMDPAHNFDPQQRETTQVQLQVPGDQEIVTLFETSFNTGVFEGTISSERGTPQPNNGSLDGQAGQTIFATYQNVTTPNPTLAQAVFTGGQILFVDASGQPASVYLVGARARVRVEDRSANVQSSAADTVIAGVTTELGGDVENLTLTETGPNTGIFEGEIDLREGPSLSGNGILETREEFGPPHEFDTLHASYVASSNGSVSTATAGTLNFRIGFIDAYGNVVTSYAQGSRAYVRVEDHRFNNPTAFDRVFVIVRSPSGDFEFIELNETTKASGIFEGSLPIDSIGAPDRDDRIQAHPGDEITAERDTGFTAELARARIDFLSLGFIDEAGQPTVEVLENGTARVRVMSPQDNFNPGITDSVQVQLRTRYAGDQENLTLTETGPNTAVFEGEIRLSLASSTSGNGTLETQRSGPPEFLPEEITATVGPFTAVAHTLASRVIFIDGFGRATSSFPVGGPVGVRVVEPARNFDPQQQEITFIQLQVPGDQEVVNLFETGANTGVFEGTISSDRGGALPNDGRLQGQAGQTILASYQNVTTPNPTLAQATFTGGQVLFVNNAGQPASVYLVGTRARVRVEDHGADVQSSAVDTVIAGVTTELGGDVESLTLTETGPSTGVFEAEIDLLDGPSLSGNGLLETREEFGPPHEFDTLHASYVASSNGSISTATAGTLSFRIWFINASGQVVTTYTQGPRVYVRIEDHRFNDPGALDLAFARVQSATGDLETVELTETGLATGIYEGSLRVDLLGTPTPDGRLQARPGNQITAERDTGFTAEPAVARIDFTTVNSAPIANTDMAEVAEDGTVSVAVLANDNDPDGDTLAVTSVAQGAHGTVAINPDQTVQYTPAANYNGSDSFSYTISDGNGESATANVMITVTSVNDVPVANADTATVAEDDTVAVTVLANDTDADGDFVTVASVTQGAHGTVSINPNQTLQYTPVANYSGSDSFTYTATDGNGGTATATVTVTITPANDAPVANADTATVAEDGTVAVAVLSNDTDPDGDTLTVTSVTQGTHGTVSINPDKTVQYTPAANYNGGDFFTYTISDGNGGTATATVTITVTAVNDPPVALPDSGSADEDHAATIAVLANDTDPEGDTLTVVSTNHQSATINPDGTVTFTPAPNNFGTFTFDYTVSDGHGGTATATVTVNIQEVNDPPTAVDDTVTTNEDGIGPFDVLANDSDADFEALHLVSVTQPAHGTATIRTGGRIDYQGNPNFNGQDSFTYTVADVRNGTSTATVFVTVVPVNDLPVANPDTATVAEDGSVVIPVLDNDTDVDGQALHVFSHAPGAHGTVTLNPDNTLTYTPAPNFNGTDSFQYKAADSQGGQSAFATVTVTVTPVNDAPIAAADSATVSEDGTVSVAVLANDTDPEGDTLTVASVTQGAHGTVAINPDKTVQYTPAANYNGSDTFTYTISDGNGGSATATVTVTITAVNDAPAANADTASVGEDDKVSVAVLANDTDADGDTLTVASVTQGTHGAVSINPDKTVKYTPAANYSGSDSFTYTISDGNGGTATATVTVTVTPVNDAPVANADTASVGEDDKVSVAVLANDTDADGDTLTVASVTQGTHGTVSINPDKTVKYTPAANYNGSDSFTYTISDGHGGTATAAVTVTITPFNDAPVANADTATLAEDSVVSVNVLANDSDADGDTLTLASVTQAAHGEVSITINNTVKYKPANDYNGPDAFTYTISDGHGGTATGSVTVSVTAVNDPPVAVNDTAATVAGSAVTINVLANDSDIDSATLTVTAVTQGAHGTVVINPDKTVTFTAALYVGADSFTYTISDGNGGTATATVNVTVAAPPRVATGIQARYNFNEGSGSTVADSSGVGTPLNLTINNTSNVTWVSGGLTVNTATAIGNNSPATKIINAAKASNAVTVEAWITPTSTSLTGPARILDLSKNSAQRNLVFGQSGNRYESQIKTSSGTPSLQSPAASLTLNLMHVVYTHNSSGQDVYYINGVQVSSQTLSGNLSSWGTDHKLTLSENWRGTYFLLAVYGRALSSTEVQQNYLAGANGN